MNGSGKATRDELIKALAKLGAHKGEIQRGRDQVLKATHAQADSMGKPIAVVSEHLAAGTGGGILAHRRLRTLSTEQGRLHAVLAAEEERKRAKRDSVPD